MTLLGAVKRLAFMALLLVPSLAWAQGGQVTLILSSTEPLPNCTPAVQGQKQPQLWDVTAQVMVTCGPLANQWQQFGTGGGGGGTPVGGGIVNTLLTATTGITSAFIPAGLPLGNGGAPIATCPYTIKPDTSVTTVDRGTTLVFNSPTACTVTLNDPSSSGMYGNFSFRIDNFGVGTVTVNRQTSAVFNVVTGSGVPAVGGTSFTVQRSQFATVHSDNGTNWYVEEPVGGGGGGGGSGTVSSCASPGGIAYYAGAGTTVVCDTLVTDNGSGALSAAALTASGAITATGDGTHAGIMALASNTTNPTIPANQFGILGFATTGATSYFLQFSGTAPSTAGGTTFPSCATPVSNVSQCTWNVGGASFSYPVTVSGAVTPGGVPFFNSSVQQSSSGALTLNHVVLGGGTAGPSSDANFDDGATTANTLTYTGSAGVVAPKFVANGTTAGFIDFPQGSSSLGVAPCTTATSICIQAPSSVVSYSITLAGTAATGLPHYANSAGSITETISAVNLANADVTGVLPFANMAQFWVPDTAQTGTYQVLASDFLGCKTIPVSSGTFTITLVASGSQPAAGQCVWIINYGTGVITIARSGQTINGAAGNLTLSAGSASSPTGAWVVSDGTQYDAQLFGVGGSGTVSSLTGDGALITNSGSTGAVTLTLGNAGAHKYWGNNTGSPTTPAYDAIVAGDLPTIPIAGGGTNATSAVAGTIPNATSSSASAWTATPTLGASGTPGSVTFGNATSGTLVLQTVTGALGTPTLSIPATTGTLFESGGTNTALAAAIYDFSAITSTAGLKVPVAAGNTATAAGAIDFDSTNKNYHSYTDGADSIFASYASAPTNGFIPKALISSGNLLLTSSLLDDGHTTANTLNYSGTGGMAAAQFVSTGTTAGFADFPEGSSSASTVPCSTATSICIQAPVTVVSYLVNLPGVVGTGTLIGNNASSVRTEAYSGDANHSAVVTTGSGTSVGSTALCSSANCPAGTYRVNVYIDVTTACGTSGTYTVNLIYTDDQGSKTIPVNINGTGAVPATGVLTTTSTSNYGENAQILRLTSGGINYSTTATACGTAGPMVGKLYLSTEAIQ